MTVDEIINAASGYIENVVSLFGDLDERIRRSADRLKQAVEDENKQIEEFQATKEQRIAAIEILDTEESTLNDALKPLRTEKLHLETEISQGVTKKGDLKIENIRLFEENKRFQIYEEKAWKVLHAKENELIDRQRALEQKESLKPNIKTLLPPVD